MGTKSDYSEENYKIDFEIWKENIKLQFERKNILRSWTPLDSTAVGVLMLDPKTTATGSSARKVKAGKEYVPEDPDPETKTSATESSARK